MSDPVSSECVVADRAGLSGAREVAVAHGQHVLRGSGEHRDRVVVAEARDADDRLDWAVSARERATPLLRRPVDGCLAVPVSLRLEDQLTVRALGDDVRAVHLPEHVATETQPCEKQKAPDETERPEPPAQSRWCGSRGRPNGYTVGDPATRVRLVHRQSGLKPTKLRPS